MLTLSACSLTLKNCPSDQFISLPFNPVDGCFHVVIKNDTWCSFFCSFWLSALRCLSSITSDRRQWKGSVGLHVCPLHVHVQYTELNEVFKTSFESVHLRCIMLLWNMEGTTDVLWCWQAVNPNTRGHKKENRPQWNMLLPHSTQVKFLLLILQRIQH